MHVTTSNGKWIWREGQECVNVRRMHWGHRWLFLLNHIAFGWRYLACWRIIRIGLFELHLEWLYSCTTDTQWSVGFVLQAATRQDMTYWLQELQQKRWEYCNNLDAAKRDSRTSPTPSDFSKGLVAKDNPGRLNIWVKISKFLVAVSEFKAHGAGIENSLMRFIFLHLVIRWHCVNFASYVT